MNERLRAQTRLVPIVIAVAIAYGLAFATNGTLIQAGTYAAIYAVAVIGLSVLLGNVAQVSLGQAGFFAVGAYSVQTGAFAEPAYSLADAREALFALGLDHLRDVYAKDLAFGDRRRVELARAVAGRPGLLLLDEPAAGLNANERDRLRRDLLAFRDRGLTLLLIEHDMRLVMEISERVMVLEFGA